jgi:Uma2 family endonuclease
MTELLDPPISLRNLARISVADFHRADELGIYGRHAVLIRGLVTEKPPMSPLHLTLSKRLYDRLLRLDLAGCSVRQDGPLTLRDSEPRPDVAVVAGSDEDFEQFHPTTALLVIEVAVSSEALDRGMAAIYADAGVREYWIVLAAKKQVEVYREPAGSDYRERRLYSADEELLCAALPAIRVPLGELFG